MKRLFISADIEGVAGVTTKEQLMPGGFEYEQARAWMTNEVVAACEAAIAQGVEQIVVADSHGNGVNLMPDRLPRCVQLVRAWPRPLQMAQGSEDGAYIGALFIGYHSGGSDADGVLAHSFDARTIAEVRLNGSVVSETGFNAAVVGHFGIPVLLVSGDDGYVDHARSVIEGVTGVVTKWSCGYASVRTLTPAESCQRIKDAVTDVLTRKVAVSPVRIAGPVNMEIQFKYRSPVELLAYLPCFRRVGPYAISYSAADMIDASRALTFICMYHA